MNTPTPTPRTEAHYDLRRQVIFSDPDQGAQLIAGSEALATASAVAALTALTAERDELRADCENETKWAAHYLAESIAVKAERDLLRAEVERLTPYVSKAILTKTGTMLCSPQVGVAFNEMRARAEKSDAELTAEREKVRVLREAMAKADLALAATEGAK
jgi:phosphoribosylaminoimidazole carboxylase (NCAIR synthetase)